MATLNEVQDDALDVLADWLIGYTNRQPQERISLIDSADDSIGVQYFCKETGESQMFRVTVNVEFFDDNED